MGVIQDMLPDLVKLTGLTYDQVNFVIILVLCFPMSYIFRTCCSTTTVSPLTRHYLSLICGAGFLTFCFGRQALHLLFSSLLGYILMVSIHETVVHRYVLICAMMYLSVIQISRMFTENGYVIDISGPLMLATIKITYVGFSIHDNYMARKDEKNRDTDQPNRKTRPTILEYFSYIFSFTSVLCGPPPEFQYYKDFIEDKQFVKYKEYKKVPSPVLPALVKSLFGYSMVACYALLVPHYAPHFLGDEKRLVASSLMSNILFAEMVVYLAKVKYYSAFFVGEGISNMAGLGFNGYNVNGKPLWNKLHNSNIFGQEAALNLKEAAESWNILTHRWLKQCVYTRVRYMPVLVTWFFSAFWHGFYPGYYMFFLSLAVALHIARKMRRKVRPYFLYSPVLKICYDIITWLCSRLIVNFYCAGFTMMDARGTLRFWRGAYYYGHVMLIVGFIIVTILPDAYVVGKIQNGGTKVQMNNDKKIHEE